MEEVKVGAVTYKLSTIRAGQMRDMAKRREDQGLSNTTGYMDDNIQVVTYCLNNADSKQLGTDSITLEQVENLDYPLFKKLLEVAQKISGFVDAKPGEVAATV